MKYIITGSHLTNKYEVGKYLQDNSEDFSLCTKFSTNEEIGELNNEDILLLNVYDVNLGYKNNAYLVLNTIDNKSNIYEGITMENFYQNNVCVVELDEFNRINENVLQTNDILVVWIDLTMSVQNKQDSDILKQDVNETKFLIERLDYTKYIYFLNEDVKTICSVINLFEYGDESTRLDILEEYM